MKGWMEKIRKLYNGGEEGEEEPSELEVVEEVLGNWHYHISRDDEPLCGCDVTTMNTSIDLDSWGNSPSHITMSWCEECENRVGISS